MLTHIVLFRRKPGVDADAALDSEFAERLAALPQAIPWIRRWRFNANELQRPSSWQWVLESDFDDQAALDAYLVHPAHAGIVGKLRHHFDWAAVDYTSNHADQP